MLSVRDLLAAAREGRGLPSNYRLARELDVPETTVQRWNTGRNMPDDATAIRLAAMAGLDPAYVVACVHAQRCTDAAVRPVLETIAERARAVAAAVAVLATAVLSVLGLWSNDAQARATTGVFADEAERPAIDETHNWRGFVSVAHFLSYCMCYPAQAFSPAADAPKV